MPEILRCLSCDGYGWFEDEFTGDATDCDWCGGVGYVYREDGIDRKIPASDYGAVADTLEHLEEARMRELGYEGSAKHPRDQAIRQWKPNDDDPPQGD